MAKFRQFTKDPFLKKMNDTTGAASVNSQVSKVLTTMRNKDLVSAEKGDWGPLMEKAMMQTRRFRNEFYA